MLVAQSCPTLQPHGLYPAGFSVHGILQARTRVGSHALSRGSSQPKDQTLVSSIAGGFFTLWASREARVCFIYKAIWNVQGHIKIEGRLPAFQELIIYLKIRGAPPERMSGLLFSFLPVLQALHIFLSLQSTRLLSYTYEKTHTPSEHT